MPRLVEQFIKLIDDNTFLWRDEVECVSQEVGRWFGIWHTPGLGSPEVREALEHFRWYWDPVERKFVRCHDPSYLLDIDLRDVPIWERPALRAIKARIRARARRAA